MSLSVKLAALSLAFLLACVASGFDEPQPQWKLDVSHSPIPNSPAAGITGATGYKIHSATLHQALDVAKKPKDVTFYTLELVAKGGTPGVEIVIAAAPGTKLDGKKLWRTVGGARKSSSSPSTTVGRGPYEVSYPPFQAIWLHGARDPKFKLITVYAKQAVQSYSIRVEFGKSTRGQLPGKIYFCGDADKFWKAPKSFLVGSFDAKILPVGK